MVSSSSTTHSSATADHRTVADVLPTVNPDRRTIVVVISRRPARLPLRARVAVAAARLVGGVARRGGRHGSVIGGRVATVLDRRVLARLAAERTVVLVTGTNGKTTTTSMIARVLGGAGHEVATNHLGANMPDGITTALLDAFSAGVLPDDVPGPAGAAPVAVMEVDESYLGEVAAATDPRVIVLLNFSRDQLDRVGEVRTVARRVGDAVAATPGGARRGLRRRRALRRRGDARRRGPATPVWVSSPTRWTGDAGVCPRCDGPVTHAGRALGVLGVRAGPPRRRLDARRRRRRRDRARTRREHDPAGPAAARAREPAERGVRPGGRRRARRRSRGRRGPAAWARAGGRALPHRLPARRHHAAAAGEEPRRLGAGARPARRGPAASRSWSR